MVAELRRTRDSPGHPIKVREERGDGVGEDKVHSVREEDDGEESCSPILSVKSSSRKHYELTESRDLPTMCDRVRVLVERPVEDDRREVRWPNHCLGENNRSVQAQSF